VVDKYIFVPITGADANDLLIFDFDGNLITNSVRDINPELEYWQLSFNGENSDSIDSTDVKITLFAIDNSQSEVLIDASTGKVIPKSLKRIR
jgi:hypothetical protein